MSSQPQTALETTKYLIRHHPLANKSSIRFTGQEPNPRRAEEKLVYHTGIHQLHLHSLSDHRTATRWRCSSHWGRQSGLPRTSARGTLGRKATKPHHSTGRLSSLSPLNLIPIDSENKITLIIKDAFLKRGFTLAVGLVRVVPAVVWTVTDPRRMDAQRRGVAADEILLFCPQLVKVRTVCVVWIQKAGNNNTG